MALNTYYYLPTQRTEFDTSSSIKNRSKTCINSAFPINQKRQTSNKQKHTHITTYLLFAGIYKLLIIAF